MSLHRNIWVLSVTFLLLFSLSIFLFSNISKSENKEDSNTNLNIPPEVLTKLPPDPGEAGKMTLAGIDSDGDGVRDDVQRWIEINITDSALHREALRQFAKDMQKKLLAGSKEEAIKVAQDSRTIECFSYLGIPADQRRWRDVQALMLNTELRLQGIDLYNDRITGQVFTMLPDSRKREACTFNVESLGNDDTSVEGAVDTSDWPTYTDLESGISFKYPTFRQSAHVSVKEGSIRVTTDVDGQEVLQYVLNIIPYSKTLEEWFAQNVDLSGSIFAGKEYKVTTLSNGVQVLDVTGELPSAHLNCCGPIANLYAALPSGDVVTITTGQEHQFGLIGQNPEDVQKFYYGLLASMSFDSKNGTALQQATLEEGDKVDHTTYLQLQSLMLKTKLSHPEVIEDSLRSYDIDGDGDQDVMGILKLTFNDSSTYIYSTWMRAGTQFSYYKDNYYDFRYGNDRFCSIRGFALKKVVLNCVESKQEYPITLRYQPNGVGYYRDVDANVIVFDGAQDWPQYVSKAGGVRFKYPPDVAVTESTYQIYTNQITVIVGMRAGKTLFEIHSVPYKHDDGGGVIAANNKVVFLKLSDGSYLSREWINPDSVSRRGVFYRRTNVNTVNNVGSIGTTFDVNNTTKGRKYTLFTLNSTDADLKEVDNIFSSISYTESQNTNSDEIPNLPENSISLGGVVTLIVPGYPSAISPTLATSTAIARKSLTITLIDSPVYNQEYLDFALYPFGSIGGSDDLGGGGYDSENKKCFLFEKDNIKDPETIGQNQACGFGWGDAGFLIEGYYVLDPEKRYILEIAKESTYDMDQEILEADLRDVVGSVQFFP